jgi:CubicO group peptidase (beta-lactamase class C family)
MALKEAVGMPISAFAEQHLWIPLGAEHNAYWQTDRKNGMEKAFCCFYAVPGDFARLGQLYLNRGSMYDMKVLSEDFITRAIQPNPYYDKMLDQENSRYGLHWWTFTWENQSCYYARGIYGQYVIVIPDQEIVIVRLGFHRKTVDETGHPPDLFEYPEIARRLLDQV